MSVPDGAVTDAGIVQGLPGLSGPVLSGSFGGSYISATRIWLRASRLMLSPDAKQYAYWTASTSLFEVHVVDIATGADRVVYRGTTLYMVLAFQSDAIYLVHAINPRQGAFEKLYRLDPAGGLPTVVPGSDVHLYQYGWELIGDGAAWGIGYRVQGSAYIYSVQRLDVATGQVTQWLEGGADELVWPLGIDADHRLYVQGINPNQPQNHLWRLAAPGQADQLANPGPISPGDTAPGTSIFVSDSVGAWLAGQGGVWLYSNTAAPKQFKVGAPTGDVFPAGPCA